MRLVLDDTIAAIASPPGGAARGIVRIAGPQAADALEDCFQADDGSSLADLRTAACVRGQFVLSDLAGRSLPCELYFWPTERSYCRMPMAEIHTLGSPPLLAAVLRSVCARGARAAEPGEFTLRAFLSGRLDLAQAEAVLGVIDATGEREFQGALAQLAGGLSRPLSLLRDELLDTLAHLEAGLDFVEEDIEFISVAQLGEAIGKALAQVEALATQMVSRTGAADVARVVLQGVPNAGKSSLFNALVNRFGLAETAALVSPMPGTTRDYLSARLVLDGVTCELIDTAGWEATSPQSPIDRAAQELSQQQITRADVTVLCIDASEAAQCAPEVNSPPTLLAWTKCDRPKRVEATGEALVIKNIATSAATGAGLDALAKAIRLAVCDSAPCDVPIVAATAQRCRASLTAATEHLREAHRLAAARGTEELLAAEIRSALHHLGEVTGAVYTDDILDRVFSRFCIGK